jgi:PAS domain S-box-containing protein
MSWSADVEMLNGWSWKRWCGQMRTEYQRTYLHLAAGNARFQAHLPNPERQPLPKHLLHARVRIRGVSGIVLSQKGQIIGARVYVPSLEFIEILDSRAADPFSLAVQPLLSLFDAVPREVTTPRIHVAGVVTLRWPSGTVFIQGTRGGLELKLLKRVPLADPPDPEAEVYSDPQPVELKIGDRVEAVGYPEMRESAPLLEDAELRKLGEGPPPPPVVLNAAQVMKGTNDAELVQIEGRLLETASRTADNFHEQVLVMQAGETIFEARLEADPASSLSVPAHSVVQLTGVCSVSLNALHEPRGFQILLRSPADVRVLQTPPLWTQVSPAKLAVTTGVLGVAILGWIWLLRRRVQDKTAELSASEARYRTMVEHAPEAIVILDADSGRFIEANDNATRLLGYSREELLQRGPRDISPPIQPDGRPAAIVAQEKIEETLAGGRPTFEWVHRTADGREIPCEIRLVRLPALSCNRVQGSITDITERKRAEEELLKSSHGRKS